MNPASFAVMMYFGPTEWILVIAALALLFGAKKIPELMRGLGQGVSEFKKGLEEPPKEDEVKKDEQKTSTSKTET